MQRNALQAVHGKAHASTPFLAASAALRPYLPQGVRHILHGQATYLVWVQAKHQVQVFLENADGRLLIRLATSRNLETMPVSFIQHWPDTERAYIKALRDRPPFSTFISNIVGVRFLQQSGQRLSRYFHKSLRLEPHRAYPVLSFLVIPQLPTGKGGFAYLVTVNVVMDPRSRDPLGTYSTNLPMPRP